ncbi:hypothetical protein [Marinoscillum sp.]|uniref:hypothetical protein n=1 Tax=Marinoscillum sp. TaxID=2024838 RepID=UPI003BAAB8BD
MQTLVQEVQVHPVKIDKSELSNYQFSKKEVLHSKEAIDQRWRDLNRGMALGNLHKVPCTIVFQSDQGELVKLEATIWAVTMTSILLKSGRLIPISCIHEVIL